MYLGVILTNNLFWNKHVENSEAKGKGTVGFVKGNLRECTKQVKAASYTTLVHQVLEYASTVWDPTTQSNIQAQEQIQKRAVRFVMTRTPCCVTGMHQDLWWDTTEEKARQQTLHAV